MSKVEWLQADKCERTEYLTEKFDRLGAETERTAKKEIEKQIFEIFKWEKEYDE